MSRARIFWSALSVSVGCALAHTSFLSDAPPAIAHQRLVFGVLNIWILAVVLLLTHEGRRP